MVIRESRGLGIQKHPANLPKPLASDPGEARIKRLTELSDGMDVVAIEANAEVPKTSSSLDCMWRKLAPPHPVAAPQIKGSPRKYFDQMVQEGLWAQHGQNQKGNAVYCPVLRCSGSIRTVYASMDDEKEPKFPEIANRAAPQRYASSEARWKNSATIRDYDIE